MRIVAGRFRGRKLHAPEGKDIRPTSDKVRGAVFNMLQSRGALEGAQALDLFCGTGALGLEALSRGAAHCTFIDNHRTSLDIARENANQLGLTGEATFVLKDAERLSMRPESMLPATLVFLDPPYGKNLVPTTLNAIHEKEWLEKDALCIAELEKEGNGALPAHFELLDERLYGHTKILLLRYRSLPAGH